ncbi:uncharacterized protein LOC122266394 isoform X2 [Penaeus japonicus]|uniref:uncharacterized protein LOC122266394 isoform X2 n=1 Tax=Penaeus japonicus TaxID=27405 RepID=UPI001C71366C|nr:uncharacterized protein LOC122266394 isoform X2 [Penaeus japonicus]
MDAVDIEKLWDCFDTNSEASQESQAMDSPAEEERLKTDAALLDSLLDSVSVCKPAEQSDSSQSDQEQNKNSKKRESDYSGDSVKHIGISDRTEPCPSSSKDGVKRPFQLNDNMKKGLSMLAYPSKRPRPRSKPRNKGPQQSQAKSKCRITIGETLEKVQDIRNSMGESSTGPETSNDSASIEDQSAILRDPEERLPLAAKPRAPGTRFKLTSRMWELLRFTFTHEHFPTSVHMARLAKMMGIQWSQVRNWFTNRRVENKKAGIFPRDKVLTDCPYCDVSLKTEAEQKGHLFASHHVKSILGPEFVGDLEPIKWKKFPTSINAINKLSGARVLAIGYSADTEADSQETLTGALESTTHTSDTLLEALAVDSSRSKSKRLRKTWQESMGLQPEPQGSPEQSKGTSSPAKGTKDKSPSLHSSPSLSQRNDSVVYLKMEDGEEKAIATEDREEKVEDSAIIKSDRFLLNKTGAPVPDGLPVVHPGDPCTSKSNMSQEAEQPQIPKTEKEETDTETIQVDQPQKSPCIVGGSQDADIELNAKSPTVVPSIPQVKPFPCDPSSDKGFQEVEKKLLKNDESKKRNIPQKAKTVELSKVYNSNPSVNSFSPPKVTSQKESISDVAIESRTKPNTGTGLSTVDTTIPEVPGSLDVKENSKYFPKYAWNRIEPMRYKLQENVGDEFVNIGYQCPTCNKVFVTEWQMMKHSIAHFKFQCAVCEQSFSSEGSLKDHLHEHLTSAYEDEKYYCQFSCKTCHSLKCECFEPLYFKAEEILRTYKRPQMARRSSKVFLSKPNSGPNDHLRVTLGSYKKSLQQMHLGNKTKGAQHHVNQAAQQLLLRNMNHPLQKNKVGHVGTENSDHQIIGGVNLTRMQGEAHKPEENQGYHEYSGTGVPALSVRNDLLITTPEGAISETHPVTLPTDSKAKPDRRRRQPGSQKRTAKLSSNFIYKDTDFYFMCEMCDASFLSKAELSEHMFFHRLKSRSRRGEKRRLAESMQEEENAAKRFKEEDLQINEEVVTINVGGFERYKCPLCKGHFASITDLNRHRTQAHKENEIIPSVNETIPVPCLEMLQCSFCNRLYRRERELRRHLKHDCLAAPEDLKNKLSIGISLTSLHEMGDGPYFSKVQRNADDTTAHHEYGTRMSPHKGPITCKYCLTVTRREAEMKRHVWKYCTKIPKAVIKRFKDGASLEELGFITGKVKVEPVTETVTSPNPKPITPTDETLDIDIETQAPSREPVFPNQTPAVPVINPVSFATSSKSKGPLICTYCGIWYFREISLLKHMRERCIKISLEEKELLQMGAGLCTYTPEVTPEICGPSEKQGTFKIVNRNQCPLTPVKKEDPEPQETTSPVVNQQEELQAVKIEPEETTLQMEMSPPKSPVKIPAEMSPRKSPVKIPAEMSPPSQTPAPKATGRKNSRCRRCHDTYSSHEAVLAHSSVHHGPKKGFYKCKLCQAKIAKYKQLREHVWEHTNETPYKCHLCDTKFRTSDSIIEHLDSLHNYKEINERNLYKWLPGRNGKYREIKEVIKSAEREETLVDMDASLDSLAEVMVVTDKDIWSGRNIDGASPRKKSTHNVSGSESSSVETSPVNKNKTETSTTTPVKVEVPQKEGKGVSPRPEEPKCENVKVSKSPGKGNPGVEQEGKQSQQTKDERIPEASVENEDSDSRRKSIDESSGNTTSNQVKTVRKRVRKKSIPPEPSNSKENQNTKKKGKPNASKSPESREQKKRFVITEPSGKVAENSENNHSSGKIDIDSFKDKNAKMTVVPENPTGKGPADRDNSKRLDVSADGSEDNGDGLLSCVENLESVIETVQITDKYLSS